MTKKMVGNSRLQATLQQVNIDLIRKNSLSNFYKVPVLKKITVHVNYTPALKDLKSLGLIYNTIFLLTGKKPNLLKARKSISHFKVRKGMFVGCKTILTKQYRYFFLDYVLSVAMNSHYNAAQLNVSLDHKNRNLYIGFDQLEDFRYLESVGLYLRRFSGLDITCTLGKNATVKIYSLFFARLGLVPFKFSYID
jgi:large subunit ribosomal protein L5